MSLRLAVPSAQAPEAITALTRAGAVHGLACTAAAGETGAVIIEGDVLTAEVKTTIETLTRLGIAEDAYRLARVDVIAPVQGEHEGVTYGGNVSWIEVLGEAEINAPLGPRYVAQIGAAAVIAACGVLTGNQILIVGAMAVSPDLVSICSACVGIVGRRPVIARKALLTLAVGLGLVAAVAALVSLLAGAAGWLPGGFHVGQGGLGGLGQTDYATVLVALAAGVAALLSFETRASAAVGVAISVTTIPASAYLGVAIATGEHGLGALLVLIVNVVLLITSGCATLGLQRRRIPHG